MQHGIPNICTFNIMLMLQIEIHKTNILASEGKILYVSVNSVKRKLVSQTLNFSLRHKKNHFTIFYAKVSTDKYSSLASFSCQKSLIFGRGRWQSLKVLKVKILTAAHEGFPILTVNFFSNQIVFTS